MKQPRLFYYEEAVDAWVPCPDAIENIICMDSFYYDDQEIEISFKCVAMTDEELDNLPEK